ncbi:MAG: sugar transferase [Lachnospiraceae bacterium]|nr:sugar transferase [Lachnospiraceae bacterium]
MYDKYFKRPLDFTLSLLGLVILGLPMLIIALVIKLDSKGPVLFWQKRIGIHKTTYMMPKFRSMRTDTPANMPTHLLNDPQRWITPVGRFLRKSSLDELPQLLSILKGDMSIVGPRPALWNQDDLIAERDRYGANDVRPGLTGWAQINGRDELPIEVKARFDGEYVENLSFAMDCKCFFGTITKVLKHDGVVEGGTGTMAAKAQSAATKAAEEDGAAECAADATEGTGGEKTENE